MVLRSHVFNVFFFYDRIKRKQLISVMMRKYDLKKYKMHTRMFFQHYNIVIMPLNNDTNVKVVIKQNRLIPTYVFL